ncbi:hypothetical protein PMAYCL1PPCAC_13940, partial [Pristionchus mayeri]
HNLQCNCCSELSIRSLMYGVIQCIQLTLLHLVGKKNQMNLSEGISVPEETTTEEIPPSTLQLPAKTIEDQADRTHSSTGCNEGNDYSMYDMDRVSTIPKFDASFHSKTKEEQFEGSKSFIDDSQNSGVDFKGDEINDEMGDYDLMEPKDDPTGFSTLGDIKIEPKEEEFKEESTLNFDLDFVNDFNEEPMMDENVDNGIGGLYSMADDPIENEGGEQETFDDVLDMPKDSSKTVQVGKRRRSSRVANRSINYNESTRDSEMGGEPTVKRSKIESVERKENKCRNDNQKTDLDCFECEYRSRSVHAWEIHLRVKHSTTPTLAGCILR